MPQFVLYPGYIYHMPISDQFNFHLFFIMRHIHGIDLFNVIVFIRATDHVITMLCHVTKIVDGKNISGSIDTN